MKRDMGSYDYEPHDATIHPPSNVAKRLPPVNGKTSDFSEVSISSEIEGS
jgi:hypothetical protein